MKRLRVVSFCLSMAVTMSFLLTACFNPAPANSAAGSKNNSNTADSENSTVDTTNKTMVLWDGNTEDPGSTLYQSFADSFAKERGVKVKRVAIAFEDLRNTIKPAINSGEGPDIFSGDPGPAYLGVYAKGGLALDLTSAAQTNGWNDKFYSWVLKQCTFNGKLYGIGNSIETLGVFYNKKVFEQYNIDLPKTYDNFLNICKLLKSKSITPLMFTDLDQWPGFHLESMWLNSGVGASAVSDVLALKTKFDQPAFAQALDKLSEIVKDGYTNSSPNSLKMDDALKQFIAGKAAMMPTGTFNLSILIDPKTGMGDNVGFFTLPPFTGVAPAPCNGIGEAWIVNAKSKNVDLAIDFLNYIFSGDRLRQWYEEGGTIPSVKGVDISSYKLQPTFKQVATTLLSANSKAVGQSLDVLLPSKVNSVTKNDIQKLLSGKITGLQCMQDKQKSLESEIQAGNYEAQAQ